MNYFTLVSWIRKFISLRSLFASLASMDSESKSSDFLGLFPSRVIPAPWPFRYYYPHLEKTDVKINLVRFLLP